MATASGHVCFKCPSSMSMMKTLFTFLFVFPFLSFGQDYYDQVSRKTPVTDAEMHGKKRLYAKDFDSGYQTSVDNWIIKRGDTLQMGKGTMPDKSFAFAYENPTAITALYKNGNLVKQYLPSQYRGNRLVVKDLGMIGAKKTGFTMAALVGVGNIVRYYVEIENAIEAGEILPPPQFRKVSTQASAAPVSVADELIKLKQLMDAGALTKDEYDAQKKKLLSQP